MTVIQQFENPERGKNYSLVYYCLKCGFPLECRGPGYSRPYKCVCGADNSKTPSAELIDDGLFIIWDERRW